MRISDSLYLHWHLSMSGFLLLFCFDCFGKNGHFNNINSSMNTGYLFIILDTLIIKCLQVMGKRKGNPPKIEDIYTGAHVCRAASYRVLKVACKSATKFRPKPPLPQFMICPSNLTSNNLKVFLQVHKEKHNTDVM